MNFSVFLVKIVKKNGSNASLVEMMSVFFIFSGHFLQKPPIFRNSSFLMWTFCVIHFFAVLGVKNASDSNIIYKENIGQTVGIGKHFPLWKNETVFELLIEHDWRTIGT